MSTLTRSERERLLDAMLEEMAERGCRGVEVESAIQRAGIADREAIEQLGGHDAWLFAAYDHLAERLVGRATEGCDATEEWSLRVRRGLEVLLEVLAANPEMTRMTVRSFPGLRPAAHARYMSLLEAFVPYLREGRKLSGAGERLPSEVEMLAVGAAEAIVFDEVQANRIERLPSLMPAILFSVLVPFVGPERASAAMQRAAQGV
jgi:hypothetical protein